jgi:XrtN system VIT domain protein
MKNLIRNIEFMIIMGQSYRKSLMAKGGPFEFHTLRLGFMFIILSSVVYGLGYGAVDQDHKLPLFVINYSLFIIYLILSILKWRRREVPRSLKTNLLYYNAALAFISCFAMNQLIPVFFSSASWLDAIIIAFVVLCLFKPLANQLGGFLHILYHVLLGVGLLLMNYYAVMLVPTYVFGLIGIIFIGIGIHSFVPLLISILLIVDVCYANKSSMRAFVAGYVLSFGSLAFGIGLVQARVEKINQICNIEVMNSNGSLPMWVNVAQKLDSDYLSYHILKADFDNGFSEFFSFRGLSRFNMEEKETHDPLVVLTSYFAGRLHLSDHDCAKTLEALSQNSNLTESRLWAGSDLKTQYVGTNILVNMAERTAYTEKTLTIVNTSRNRRDQEAIYTFQLPEGAVVTALSLWIDGKEAKAVLTSKAKATNAYNTIVGKERRDPSVIHWKEGNTVSIRVFPCNSRQERIVKMGVVAPLVLNGKYLKYKSIRFVGTDLSTCKERIQVKFDGDGHAIELPSGFAKETNMWVREATLDMDFSCEMPMQDLALRSFSHEGYTYTLKPYHKEYVPKIYKTVYLDLNNTWTKNEIEAVAAMNSSKSLYYIGANQECIAFSNSDLEGVYAYAQENKFSLFPFFVVKEPSSSLVVTKSSLHSPNLSTIVESGFGTDLKEKIKDQKYDVFNLGRKNNLYLQSLNQFGVLNMEYGDVNMLERLIAQKQFLKNPYDESKAVFPQNASIIERSLGMQANTGTDFLVRMFVYQKVTMAYLPFFLNMAADSTLENNLITQGQMANVVTPTTSLIVLETQQDYERFDVKNTTNTLGNSSMFKKNNAGAAPEPHEWAIIMLCVLILIYFYRDKLFVTYRQMFYK